jgi:tyrosyl-tRNA synthetase
MIAFRSDFLQELKWRGFIHQISQPLELLDDLAVHGGLTAYVGYDCTAPSLHVGHLLSIMMLHWLQQTGNKPIVLMGGGTTRVGDPSGRDESRKLLTYEEIEANKMAIRRTFREELLRFGQNHSDAIMADNAEWLTDLNYIEMLRNVGRHFSINRMLSMDSVKMRLEREQELSFIEFNYMILQSYDFVELARRYGCNLQMGGSDQWGNIVNGIELGRRMDTHQLYALTCPLLTTASGAKMGKTAKGAVWLNPDLLSPFDYWQFWRNTEDADVDRFLKLFTTLTRNEITRLSWLRGNELNEAKRVLATEATRLVHGEEAAAAAEMAARRVFEYGATSEDLNTISVSRGRILQGFGILEANTALAFSRSNGEARKLVESGAIRLSGHKIMDPFYKISLSDFNSEGQALLERGKLKKGVIKLIDET